MTTRLSEDAVRGLKVRTRWGTYTRISDDAKDERAGVTRQGDDTREAVENRGGDVAEAYEENDTSAYKKRKVWVSDPEGNRYAVYRVLRPVWQQALADLRSGKIDALMVWDIDRLARDPRDLEDAIEVVEYYGKRIESVIAGQTDLMTDGGRAMARVMVAMGAKSSADTSRRVAREALARAQKGVPVGGTRPFGWKADRVALDAGEARLVREAVRLLLDEGQSLHSIARYWNREKVTTTKGNMWDATGVRQYMTNPRLAGFRNHLGVRYPGAWVPMVTEETFALLEALFAKNKKKAKVRGLRPGGRKYLLSGLMRCGQCNGSMHGNINRPGVHAYACRGRKTGSDHAMTIVGAQTEQMVVEMVLAEMASKIVPNVERDGEYSETGRLTELRAEKKDVMARMNAKKISVTFATAAMEMLEEEEAPLVAGKADWEMRVHGPSAKRVTAIEFDAMPLEDRRELISDWVTCVMVSPPIKRSRFYDHRRVEIVWSEQE